MAETGLTDLLVIMRDRKIGMRDRLNAAVSASRVSPLAMSGEAEPPAIAFLRWLLAYKAADGEQFSPSFRRESAAAIAFGSGNAGVPSCSTALPIRTRDARAGGASSTACCAVTIKLSALRFRPFTRDIMVGIKGQRD
jgi:hypothetical protein